MRVESGERALATAHGWPRETMMGGECLPPAPCLDDTVPGRRSSTVCPSQAVSREKRPRREYPGPSIYRVCENVPSSGRYAMPSLFYIIGGFPRRTSLVSFLTKQKTPGPGAGGEN